MTITVIPVPTVTVPTASIDPVTGEIIENTGSSTFLGFTLPSGATNLLPLNAPGRGLVVEIQGDGEFVGTDLSDQIFSTDDLPKTIVGLDGDDGVSMYGSGPITFNGNAGNDSFDGGSGSDIFYGGIGDDGGNGGEGADLLFGDLGNDQLTGGPGDDTLLGGLGNDGLSEQGTPGGDNLFFGGQGNDTINGGLGNELLSGDGGDDNLEGDGGNDTLIGGEGFDILTGGSLIIVPDDFSAEYFTGDFVQDIFAIETSDDGFDLVVDFEEGIDKLGLPAGVEFSDLLIAPAGVETEIINQQSSFMRQTINYATDINDPNSPRATINLGEIDASDIVIRLAATEEILTILNSATGGDPTIPVLDVTQITADDFISL
ncbi:MAG: calcium-binding protein [Microcoleaceae cyanobacterium]